MQLERNIFLAVNILQTNSSENWAQVEKTMEFSFKTSDLTFV